MRPSERLRALVTGATSGIGAAIVERLCSDGAAVVFTGRDADRGEAVAARTGASFVRADVRDPDAVRASVQAAVSKIGGLDTLVANAGVLHQAPLSRTSDAAWDTIVETNLTGAYLYAVAALPALRAAGGGSITMVSSDAGIWGETTIGAYSVSKRALNMLVQVLAVEAGPAGIRVNAVCPGDTAPGMATHVGGRITPDDASGWMLPTLGRVGTAADVASAVAFFTSPQAAFCNGSILLVDGGMRASLRAFDVASERSRAASESA
jgi:meso-butanediol dehydrogenase / (S,S)-butanediol dehydrogenase / diacetyl reductase